MKQAMSFAGTGARSLSVFLGLAAIVLAGSAIFTTHKPAEIANWALDVFGITFIVLLSGLVFLTLFSWVRYGQEKAQNFKVDNKARVWMETGLHAANGISTLALTYTLLGISLGIGTLADQNLNPDTVQGIIRGLTEHFSLAFLTTVVGLPISAALRALLLVTEANYEKEKSL